MQLRKLPILFITELLLKPAHNIQQRAWDQSSINKLRLLLYNGTYLCTNNHFDDIGNVPIVHNYVMCDFRGADVMIMSVTCSGWTADLKTPIDRFRTTKPPILRASQYFPTWIKMQMSKAGHHTLPHTNTQSFTSMYQVFFQIKKLVPTEVFVPCTLV